MTRPRLLTPRLGLLKHQIALHDIALHVQTPWTLVRHTVMHSDMNKAISSVPGSGLLVQVGRWSKEGQLTGPWGTAS